MCKLMGITGRKRKLTIEERNNWRNYCKAGGLALDRSRDGSFLVTGRRAL